jgi:hypothetical protein
VTWAFAVQVLSFVTWRGADLLRGGFLVDLSAFSLSDLSFSSGCRV